MPDLHTPEWTVTLSVFLLAALSMGLLDRPLLVWLHAADLDSPLVETISDLGKSQWYLIGAPLIYLVWPGKVGRSRAALVFWSVAASGILVDVVKVILARPRPDLFLDHGLYAFDFFRVRADFLSFPSGHTATAFSLAACLAVFWPRGRFLFLAGATCIGSSRILLEQHYPSDVFVGAWFGTFTVFWLLQGKKHPTHDPSPLAGGDPGNPPGSVP